MKKCLSIAYMVLLAAGCGTSGAPDDDTISGDDIMTGEDTATADTSSGAVSVYAGSASHGDLVVFSVDHESGTCEVVNETTGQTSNVSFTVRDDQYLAGILDIAAESDHFYAVELTNKLIAANFDTGNPNNTISFGVSGGTNNMANKANIPGDYVYIHISNAAVNGSTDIKEWGLLSIIDDGTYRVRAYATDAGDNSLAPMAPEAWSGAFPVETPNVTGTWDVNDSDHARIDVTMDGSGVNLTGFAYAPDPNGIFVLDMGTGYGFILAMKILPTMTLANLAGEYKFINVWNDSMGAGRSAGRAVINADGSGSFGHLDVNGNFSAGGFDPLQACPNIQNMFFTSSVEMSGDTVVYIKHYFVLLPYAIMGFNFRTDGGFRFVGYSVGARLD